MRQEESPVVGRSRGTYLQRQSFAEHGRELPPMRGRSALAWLLLVLSSSAGATYAQGIPDWMIESNQAGAHLGTVSSAGDVNGDGFEDVVVGAISYSNGEANEGAVFLYLGSASGLETTAAWSAEGNQADAQFGYPVAGAGDVNGDGYDDVIVGAQLYDNGEIDEGRAYVYLGSPLGLSASPAWTTESNQAGAWYGHWVASAGDVNNDTYADVIVGAPFFGNGQAGEGRAYVYLGSASGLSTTPVWTDESNQAGAWFGEVVATAGDVNGDGFSDVIVGASFFDNPESDEGAAFVYLGSLSGPETTPSWSVESDLADALFGRSVSSAGDVNADGFDDVLVGAIDYADGQTSEGRAYLYLGSSGGLATTPAWTFESDQTQAQLGHAVADAGDVNGDGYDDVIAGAFLFDQGETDEGRVFLFLGTSTGLGARPAKVLECNSPSAQFGLYLSAADVDADGYSDVIVGARNFSNGESEEGGVFLYLGQPSFGEVLYQQKISNTDGGLNPGPGNLLDFDDAFGIAMTALGDLNGDGVVDLAVGAHQDDDGGANFGAVWILFMNPDGTVSSKQKIASGTGGFPGMLLAADDNFGVSVACLGDLDGDSIPDLAVGAYRDDEGGLDRGAVWILFLNANGTVKSQTLINDGHGGLPTGVLQNGDGFGISLASLGDLDGDGVADLAVGAFGDDDGGNNRGAVWILFLNTDGTVKSRALISDGMGGLAMGFLQDDDQFGYGMGLLGDLDGSGGSKLALGVGGRSPDAGGVLWVLFLDSTGAISAGTAVSRITEGSGGFSGDLDFDDGFGYAVERLGNVGGSGSLDVAVSAVQDDDNGVNAGAVWILSLDSSGTVVSQAKLSEGLGHFQGDLDAGDVFGTSLSLLGDLDGDGRSDLGIGAAGDADGGTPAGAVWVVFLNDGSLHLGAKSTTWTGSTDSDWTDSSNWGNGVPDASRSAIIPDSATTPNDPQITASGQACDSLWIQAGGTLDVSAGTDSLGVVGGATVSGPITGTGELVFAAPGTLASNSTLSNTGGVRSSFDLSLQGGPQAITGNVTASANLGVRRSAVVTIGGNLSVAGNLAVDGSLFLGGLVAIDGDLTGSNEGIISGNSANCEISVGGDLDHPPAVGVCHVRLENPNNTFVMVDVDGSLPASLIIDFPAGGGAILAADLTIEGGLEILNGSLDVQGNALTLTGLLPVLIGDTLLVGAGGRVRLEENPVTVPNGGRLRLVGTPTALARFTGVNGGGYTFLVEAGGTLEARNFAFEDMDGSGIGIERDALIGAFPDDLRNGLFDRATTSGQMLALERASPASFRYLSFENTTGLATSNVLVPPSSSPISFVNWSGAFAGEAFDDDSGNLLTWGPNEESLVSDFTARRLLPTSVRLHWTSTLEIDCEAYVLERGPSASGPWTAAGEVAAVGPAAYTHEDTGALADTAYHYRLSERLTHGALRVLAQAFVKARSSGRPAPSFPNPFAFRAGGVGPGREFPSIQAALDALGAGPEASVRLTVEPGTYEGFTLDARGGQARSWRILAAQPGTVTLDVSHAPLALRGLAADSSLELSGLVLRTNAPDLPALRIEDCAGVVLLDGLALQGELVLERAGAVLLQGSKLGSLLLDHGSHLEASTSALESATVRGGSRLETFGGKPDVSVEPGSRWIARDPRPALAVTRSGGSAAQVELKAAPGGWWWLLAASDPGPLGFTASTLEVEDLARYGPARSLGSEGRVTTTLRLAPGSEYPTSLRALVLDPLRRKLVFSEIEHPHPSDER